MSKYGHRHLSITNQVHWTDFLDVKHISTGYSPWRYFTSYRVSSSWKWCSLHWGSLIAAIIPQHYLARVCATNHQIGMKFCKCSWHHCRLKEEKQEPKYKNYCSVTLCLKLKEMRPNITTSLPKFIQYIISLLNYLRIHPPLVTPQQFFLFQFIVIIWI